MPLFLYRLSGEESTRGKRIYRHTDADYKRCHEKPEAICAIFDVYDSNICNFMFVTSHRLSTIYTNVIYLVIVVQCCSLSFQVEL